MSCLKYLLIALNLGSECFRFCRNFESNRIYRNLEKVTGKCTVLSTERSRLLNVDRAVDLFGQ